MFRQTFRSTFSSSLRTTSLASRVPPQNVSAVLRFAAPTLARFLSLEVRKKLEHAVKEYPLVLFMKGTPDMPQCGFSRAVCQILELHGVPPEKMKAYDVLQDSELRSAIKEFSEWPTIPQVYVNGEFVGGCDIVLGMHQSGELEILLENNHIIEPTKESSPESSATSS